MPPDRVGIKDVAARAGVSIGTVSNVLNQPDIVSEPTRRAVVDAIEELGFVRNGSASRLRSARSTVVGLVVLDIGNPFFTDVARGAEAALQRSGYTVMVCNSGGSAATQRQHLRFLEEQRVAGVLITPVDHRRDAGDLDRLRERGLSVVLVDETAGRDDVCSVSVGDVRGGELVGHHLAGIGRRRIVDVTASERVRQCLDRSEGLRRGVREAGVGDEVIVGAVELPALNGASGYAAVDEVLALRPDAVFCANDLVALGDLRGLFERGVSIPGDVALVGFDDIDFAGMAVVPLTSVRQPAAEMGQAAAALLAEECGLGEDHVHQRVLFSPELIVRRSSTPGGG